MREFTSNQKQLFKEFDRDGDKKISAKEMLDFMQDNLIKGVRLEDCA
jgi:Ca2+-binding EF-hand superfamily protein